MSTVFFRLDANERIGMGHAGRCLAVAAACVARGLDVCFLVADEWSAKAVRRLEASSGPFDRLRDRNEVHVRDRNEGHFGSINVRIQILDSDYEHPEAEIPAAVTIMKEECAKGGVVFFYDSYFIGEAYLTKLRAQWEEETPLFVATFDDFGRTDLPVDMVVNYQADAKEVHYTQADVVLAGMSYAPVRGTAAGASTGSATAAAGDSRTVPLSPSSLRVLVTAGGADAYGMTGAVANALSEAAEKEDLPLTIVTADGSVKDMATLMRSCDLAVTAGGTTLIELCALGIPAVVFTTADNQFRQVRALAAAGAISFAGSIGDVTADYVPQEKPAVIANILSQVRTLLDETKRERMSEAMHRLTDGRGAERIASALQNA